MEYMYLSKLELKILQQIANGNTDVKKISENLNRDISRIYRAKNKLIEKNLIDFSNGKIIARRIPHVNLLLQLLMNYPNIIALLSDSGVTILTQLIKEKTVSNIEERTRLKKSIIYQKIKQSVEKSIVIKKGEKKYVINKNIWPDLKEFLTEYERYSKTVDIRIPINSKIYYKKKEEIIFSNKGKIDASLTAFSSYEKYGIKLMLTKNYYYLPKKVLTKKDIFLHSLCIAEKDKNVRNITFVCLFYLKYNKDFLKVKNPILENIKKVLEGKYLKGYPTRDEIIEKAKVYDIKI